MKIVFTNRCQCLQVNRQRLNNNCCFISSSIRNKDCNENLFRQSLKNCSEKPGHCKAKDCPDLMRIDSIN